jgi:hypothetical protein
MVMLADGTCKLAELAVRGTSQRRRLHRGFCSSNHKSVARYQQLGEKLDLHLWQEGFSSVAEVLRFPAERRRAAIEHRDEILADLPLPAPL